MLNGFAAMICFALMMLLLIYVIWSQSCRSCLDLLGFPFFFRSSREHRWQNSPETYWNLPIFEPCGTALNSCSIKMAMTRYYQHINGKLLNQHVPPTTYVHIFHIMNTSFYQTKTPPESSNPSKKYLTKCQYHTIYILEHQDFEPKKWKLHKTPTNISYHLHPWWNQNITNKLKGTSASLHHPNLPWDFGGFQQKRSSGGVDLSTIQQKTPPNFGRSKLGCII